MTVTNPTAIIDAVTSDILANSGLTPTTVFKYAEPVVILPAACPLLTVWCEQTDFQILTPNPAAYERRHQIEVAWYVASPLMADTAGSGDPTTVHQLDATAETLEARIVTYTNGIPGFASQLIGTLQARRLEPQAGTIWRALLTFTAEEAS